MKTQEGTKTVRGRSVAAGTGTRAVQTALKSQLPYWMRWLSWTWMRDLLLLIHEADRKPSAMSLGPLGARNGILLRKDGAPLSEGAQYHYRMALRHLGIVEVRDGLYYPNLHKAEVAALAKNGRAGEPLSPVERDSFASLIVQNADCRTIFLRLLMDRDSFSLTELRMRGTPCFIYYPEGTDEIVIENPATRRRLRYQSPAAQNATIWGVRTWCLQLDVLDELMLPAAQGSSERRHLIFPIQPGPADESAVRRALQEALPPSPDERTVELLHVLSSVCPKNRLSPRAVKAALSKLATRAGSGITLLPAPRSEEPTAEPAEGGVDRLHQKGWLKSGARWHRKVSFSPTFWALTVRK